MAIPEGWTDDMTIPLPPGLAVEEIVELILRAWGEGAEYETTIEKLVSLGLPEEDACLCIRSYAWRPCSRRDGKHGKRTAEGEVPNCMGKFSPQLGEGNGFRCVEHASCNPEPAGRRWWHFWK